MTSKKLNQNTMLGQNIRKLYKVSFALLLSVTILCMYVSVRCFQEYDSHTNSVHRRRHRVIDTHISTIMSKLNNNDFQVDLNKKIYIITPTHSRLTQRADITRLYNTIRWVPNIHWVVVEDASSPTEAVRELLLDSLIENYTNIAIETPGQEKKLGMQERSTFHRGVNQRNLALQTVKNLVEKERLANKQFEAVVYLCDDDNTYDVRLFSEIRKTNMVSVFNVAFVGGQTYEGPLVSELSGKVDGFHVSWHPERVYPTDMAGFSFNVDFLFKTPMPLLSHESETGRLESDFLAMMLGDNGHLDLEPRAPKSILIWHTRTEVPNTKRELKLKPDPVIRAKV